MASKDMALQNENHFRNNNLTLSDTKTLSALLKGD
jgi:hypothetical protein